MTVTYVVPCGISVLDKLGNKLPAGGGPVSAFVRAVAGGAWVSGTGLARDQQVLSAWRDKEAGKADAAGLIKAVPKWLSAETHSLAGRQPVISPLTGGRVLLLSSDTRAGVSAAFCVAHYLAGGIAANLSYASMPGPGGNPPRLDAASATVTVVRITGLKPDSPDFSAAVTGIGNALHAASEQGGSVEVHLTGGFKATLLHTLAMTEVLHSLSPGRVSAWYVFEDVIDTASDQPLTPMPIGLRSFPRAYLNNMRTELSLAAREVRPLSDTFKGFAWDEDNAGTPRLNAFGHGYLAVLGQPVTSLGDDNS